MTRREGLCAPSLLERMGANGMGKIPWWSRSFVVLLLFGVFASSVVESGGFIGPYQKGRRAIEQKDWQVAVDFFQLALAEREEEGEMVRLYGVGFEHYLPRYYLGVAYFQLGEPRKALWEWKKSERQGAILDSPQYKTLIKLQREAEWIADQPEEGSSPEHLIADGAPVQSDRVVEASVAQPGSENVLPADLQFPESYALVVGASNYDDRSSWPSLPGVQEDTFAVEQALKEHGFEVKVLRDPTKQQLVVAMEDFFYTKAKSEASRLIFYYAGHGENLHGEGKNRGYLVPVDAPHPGKDRNAFKRRAISMARFQEYASEAPSRHLLLLFDSCFSGSVFDVVRSVPVSGSVREKAKEKSRMFIAAGDADQVVPDKSFFRRAFVEALDGSADLNSDGVIFGIELGQFIADQVMNRPSDNKRPQTPRWGRSGEHSKGDIPFESKPRDGMN